MPALDTNCLVRWLVRDDPSMTARVDSLIATERRLRVSDVALIETVYVLEGAYQFSRTEVATAIRLLLSRGALELDRALWAEILDLYEAHPKLSCTDVYLACDTRRRGDGPLHTFDRKLVNQLGAVSP